MSGNDLTTPPRALLLDFGGVIFQTSKRPSGRDEFSQKLIARLARLGTVVEPQDVRRAVDAGLTALKHWKHASSRRLEPTEMSHREVVADFLATDLPAQARAILEAEASDVLAEMQMTLSDHELRPGIREILEHCVQHGIALGIVSNAHSGRNHRELLTQHGIYHYFDVQVYSDEVGIRKPHPGMIHMAADALGVKPSECWYVGDTQDRDVVAGRRADIGAVILTASQHTETPPFEVGDQADAVFPTPEGLLKALRATAGSQVGGVHALDALPTEPAQAPTAALLIDHGGVISTSLRDETAYTQFAEFLARLLDAPHEPFTTQQVLDQLQVARERHKERKTQQLSAESAYREVSAREFWRDMFGGDLSPRAQALLSAEAVDLMYRFGLAKSHRTLRPGVSELLQYCAREGVRVVVVSNTINGRSVRDSCKRLGVDQFIGAYVCSDEQGFRKPHPSIVQEALEVSGTDAAQVWFLGDKPQNDAAGAQAVGIAHRVIISGGATERSAITQAVSSGLATHHIENAHDLIPLMREHLSPSQQHEPTSIGA